MTASNLHSAQYMPAAEETVPSSEGQRTFFKSLGWIAVLAGVAFAVWNFYQQGDYIAALVTALVSWGATSGFRQGLLGIVVTLVAIAVATQFAIPIGQGVENLFAERLGTTGILHRCVSVSCTGLVIYLGFNLFVTTMLWIVLGNQDKPHLLGRLLGSLFGATQWAAASAIGLGGLVLLLPILEQTSSIHLPGQLVDQVNSTCLRPWAERYNPVQLIADLKIQQIETTTHTLRALADPPKLNQLLNDARVQQLRNDPEFEEIWQELQADAEIAATLRSQSPIDAASIAHLLQSPTVLKIWDQPKFRKQAKIIIGEMREPTSQASELKATSPATATLETVP